MAGPDCGRSQLCCKSADVYTYSYRQVVRIRIRWGKQIRNQGNGGGANRVDGTLVIINYGNTNTRAISILCSARAVRYINIVRVTVILFTLTLYTIVYRYSIPVYYIVVILLLRHSTLDIDYYIYDY